MLAQLAAKKVVEPRQVVKDTQNRLCLARGPVSEGGGQREGLWTDRSDDLMVVMNTRTG